MKTKLHPLYIVLLLIILLTLFAILGAITLMRERKPEACGKQIIVIDKAAMATDEPSLPIYPKSPPRYSNRDYQQMGVLTSHESEKEPIVLPLFGRKIDGRSDRYQYYTATDKQHMMRLPLHIDNRDCEDTVGCREIYSGDTLTISIYHNRIFTATIYKVEAPRYFASAL